MHQGLFATGPPVGLDSVDPIVLQLLPDYLHLRGSDNSTVSEICRHLPQLAHALEPTAEITAADTLGDVLNDVYARLPSVSIDVGVMERAQDVWVVPADIGWSDVGSWRALGELLNADAQGNVVIGEQRGIDTAGCFIHSPSKLVATIGLSNLVVIETDDVLLICPKERDQDVRKLVELLEREGRQDLL